MTVEAQFPAPLQCLFQPKRYKVLWGGRGAGRSWGVARALLIMGTGKPLRVLCARELQNSISESVHKLLSDQIAALGLSDFYDIEVARIKGKNGTSFSFEGIKNNTNKIKSYEGIDICWVEEAIKVSRHSWGVLIPTIRKSGSEIWMCFNPELDSDYTYQRFVKDPALVTRDPSLPNVRQSEATFCIKMTWRDNPWFLSTELYKEMLADKARDYDYYLNVWEGHTIQVLEGAVYARELRKATAEGRICTVPWDQEVPVSTFWDIGRADATAIWFAQRVAMQYRILAYYEARGIDIPIDEATGGVMHFIKVVQQKGFVYEAHYLPHDAKSKRLGTKRTIEELVRTHLKPAEVLIVPKQSIADGINAARMIFNQCWFDETDCEDGLKALRHYRYKVIDGQLSNEPLHDWASDGADGFKYLALGMTGKKRGGVAGVLDRLHAAGEALRGRDASGGRPDSAPSGLGWMS